MDIHDRPLLKHTSAQALSAAGSTPRNLVMLHTGVALGFSLLATVLQYILSLGIGDTGGLAGLGMRSVLSSAQSFLQVAGMILLPFWEMGILRALLLISRRQEADKPTLLDGFRRFGPIFRLQLLRLVMSFGISIVSTNIGVFLFALTPFSKPLMESILPLMTETADPTLLAEQLPADVINQSMLPLAIIIGVLFLLLYIPVSYRIRMADYAIMDQPKTGAFAAVGISIHITRRKAMALFRLDLSFWWYYLLELLLVAVCYSYDLLVLAGVTLPISQELGYFGSYGLYLIGTFALALLAKAKVQTTYAVAYDTLLPTPPSGDDQGLQPTPSVWL